MAKRKDVYDVNVLDNVLNIIVHGMKAVFSQYSSLHNDLCYYLQVGEKLKQKKVIPPSLTKAIKEHLRNFDLNSEWFETGLHLFSQGKKSVSLYNRRLNKKYPKPKKKAAKK